MRAMFKETTSFLPEVFARAWGDFESTPIMALYTMVTIALRDRPSKIASGLGICQWILKNNSDKCTKILGHGRHANQFKAKVMFCFALTLLHSASKPLAISISNRPKSHPDAWCSQSFA